MEIRRSEVYLVPVLGNMSLDLLDAIHSGKRYFALSDKPEAKVFPTGDYSRIVCTVRDLIDDRPSPFPPLEAESSNDTPTDQAIDAALRSVEK